MIAMTLAMSLVVSTANVPVASASGWRKMTLTISVEADANYQSIKLSETRRYQIWWRQIIIHSNPETILTITVKVPAGDLPSSYKGTVLSFSFRQGDLYFTGWKGTLEATYPGSGAWDSYDISGSGVGSYGPGSHFGDAFVRGRIHIDDYYEYIESVVLMLQVTMRYYVP